MIKHLYIHIPFCKRICPYCDFAKRVSNDLVMERYKKKLIEEIEYYGTQLFDVETIFIGGGTPSYYPYLFDVLKALSKYIDKSKIKEYTIESTPETTLNLVPYIKEFGVNRISIGVESLNKKTIEYLNRKDTSYECLKNVMSKLKNEGVKSINLDFIYSLPFETVESIKEELEEIKKLNPDHLSFYDLILEENTILSYDLKNKRIILPSEDESVEMREIIEKSLKDMGYIQYEISNYSKPGFESIHNMSYWKLENYLGLGLNSHSLIDEKRFSNTGILKEYLKYDFNKIKEEYEMDPMGEYFLMGLRMNKGVSISEFMNRFNIDPILKYDLKKHIESGLLEIENGYLRFTDHGRHIGNIVFEEFI